MEQHDMIRMANQIAAYFNAYPADEARKEVAEHINKFWEPRMRRQLFEFADAGQAGLAPLVAEALPLVKRPG